LLNEKADWKNFHAGTKKNPGKLSAGDRKLRNVLGGSKYKGAYMTDIIKDVAHGNAKIFIKTLTPEDIKTNIGYFIEEIELLRSNEIEMFLFGNEVEKIFRGYCECLAKIKKKVKICQRIEHFSPSNPRFESIARVQLGLASGDILKKTLWGK
jgi:hypothetical protein